MEKYTFTKYNLDELQLAIATADSYTNVCEILKIYPGSANIAKIKYFVKLYSINVNHLLSSNARYNISELVTSVESSICWSDVCRNLNISVCTYNFKKLQQYCKDQNICTEHFAVDKSRKHFRPETKWTRETVLVENCSIGRSQLRKVLIRLGMYTGECSECLLTEWNGKPIIIEIDHKNGDHTDNREYNLRWLCPNCHSQTPTYRRST